MRVCSYLVLSSLFIVAFGCTDLSTFLESSQNSKDVSQPYLVVLAIDGFLGTYIDRFHLKALAGVRDRGVLVEKLVPVFPADSYPAYYAASTGLPPEENGIVANAFYDPQLRLEFDKARRFSIEDGNWYGGTPFWIDLERGRIKTASFFWPGGSAEIQGIRPTYFHSFEGDVSFQNLAEEVKTLFSLPDEKRPRVLFLLSSNLDAVSHIHGPHAAATEKFAQMLDRQLEMMMESLKKTGLPINYFFLSLYGMDTLKGKIEYLEDYINVDEVRIFGNGSRYLIYHDDASVIERVFQNLRNHSTSFRVYKRKEVPIRYNCNKNPRCGDLMVVTNPSHRVRLSRKERRENEKHATYKGAHGYDVSESPAMAGVLLGEGPHIQKGIRIPQISSLLLKEIILRLYRMGKGHEVTQGDVISTILVPRSN